MAGSAAAPSRGFTLIELLVVIAILAILLAILLPSLASARGLARGVREASAAQQVMVAFQLYANDHAGFVLPGFPDRSEVSGASAPFDDRGEPIGDVFAAQRYPWRLAPYLEYNFAGLYKDDKVLAELRQRRGDFQYVVSLYPTLGMNSAFVGGSVSQLGDPTSRRIFGRVYVRRDDEARRPTEVLAFASARFRGAGTLPELPEPGGFFRVEAPTLGAGWQEAYDERAPSPGINSGFIALRHNGRAVAAMLDGHAELLGWDEILDMRRWADGADRADWAPEPRRR
ncbi:MAG: prepilin-type N-terminal cleavage/methylation domain-containing protein [Planctomycetota bacterium]